MAGNINQPVIILSNDSAQTKGRDALDRNISAAKAIAETVRSTLGPNGLDKMIVGSKEGITITNDGCTILQTIEVENPAARMMIEVAQAMEKGVGDGTTSSTVFASELLSHALELLDKKVHPTTIIKGYNLASVKALELLNELSETIEVQQKELEKVTNTAINSRGSEKTKELLSEVSVKAALKAEKDGKINVDTDVHILNADGVKAEDTHVVNGIAIFSKRANEDMPTRIENAKIALVNDMEPKDIGSKMGTVSLGPKIKLEIDTAEKLQMFSDAKSMPLYKIINRVDELGVNVVLCKTGIREEIVYEFAKRGIFAVKIASEEEVEVVARATGARLIPHAERLSDSDLGHAKLVEERGKKDKEIVYFEDCQNPHIVTIVTSGRTDTSNMGNSIVGALHVVKDIIENNKIVPGAGAVEIEIAQGIKEYAPSVPGREYLAIQAFAEAIESIPVAIAKNSGFAATDMLIELRAKHKNGYSKAGIDVNTGTVADDISTSGIIEPVSVKIQLIKSATETANMLLRIDDVISVSRRNPPSENIKAPGEMGPDEGYFNTVSQPNVPSRLDY
ncbi:MAG: Thermosome subunit [Candidatus Argoarchaeum ethanivorans]|uniref:Thermosome subunit n=1 Tax=Candidatus Argoarchaeum ethanivorans TaxID=2608793 RepID=A0A811T764_9EURY|nr:MAG: Thermosome subunit [Candidatus Argoarchaeum ethanivorans]